MSGKYQSRFLSPIVILFPVMYFIPKWQRPSKVFLPFSDQFNSSVYKPGALKPTERRNRAKRKYSTTLVTNPKSAAVDLSLSETLKSTRTCFGQRDHSFGELVPDLWSIRTYPGMEMSQAKITATETDYK